MFNLKHFFGRPPETAPPGQLAASYLVSCDRRRFKADAFLDQLLADALHWNATDIHVIPESEHVSVRLRIDGALRNFLLLQPLQGRFLVGRLKVVGELDVLNTFSPQDGAGRLEIAGEVVAFRVSIMPVRAYSGSQERAILRLFRRRNFDLKGLGMDNATLQQWKSLLTEPQGMLVLTGPANSGKTTTIYSSLLEIQHRSRGERNIATIEDPVEFAVPGLSQSQVNPGDGFGFTEALRAMMRQDPQVIMIGEIRDGETAKIAVEAGLTGHLVLTTVHSKQVTGVFPRLLSLGVGAVRAASAILAVLNQRLLRLNCPFCAQPYLPAEEMLGSLPRKINENAQFMRGAGCDFCRGTGFYGRGIVNELLVVNAEMRSAVCTGALSQDLYARAIDSGMRTIWQSAMEAVLSGRAPLEQAIETIGPE